MFLQNSLQNARTRYELDLVTADSAFGPQDVFRLTARTEAGTVFQQGIAAAFDADFDVVVSSQKSSAEKLPQVSAAFQAQKKTYEAVFSDTVNRELCRKESMKALQKAFRAVFSGLEERPPAKRGRARKSVAMSGAEGPAALQ